MRQFSPANFPGNYNRNILGALGLRNTSRIWRIPCAFFPWNISASTKVWFPQEREPQRLWEKQRNSSGYALFCFSPYWRRRGGAFGAQRLGATSAEWLLRLERTDSIPSS